MPQKAMSGAQKARTAKMAACLLVKTPLADVRAVDGQQAGDEAAEEMPDRPVEPEAPAADHVGQEVAEAGGDRRGQRPKERADDDDDDGREAELHLRKDGDLDVDHHDRHQDGAERDADHRFRVPLAHQFSPDSIHNIPSCISSVVHIVQLVQQVVFIIKSAPPLVNAEYPKTANFSSFHHPAGPIPPDCTNLPHRKIFLCLLLHPHTRYRIILSVKHNI